MKTVQKDHLENMRYVTVTTRFRDLIILGNIKGFPKVYKGRLVFDTKEDTLQYIDLIENLQEEFGISGAKTTQIITKIFELDVIDNV